jgi:outer membrane biosynthesis protein TonB
LLDAAKASEDRVAALMAGIHRDVVARLAVEADPVPLKRQCASAPLPAPAPAPAPAPKPQPAPAPAPQPQPAPQPAPAPAPQPNEPVMVDLTDD